MFHGYSCPCIYDESTLYSTLQMNHLYPLNRVCCGRDAESTGNGELSIRRFMKKLQRLFIALSPLTNIMQKEPCRLSHSANAGAPKKFARREVSSPRNRSPSWCRTISFTSGAWSSSASNAASPLARAARTSVSAISRSSPSTADSRATTSLVRGSALKSAASCASNLAPRQRLRCSGSASQPEGFNDNPALSNSRSMTCAVKSARWLAEAGAKVPRRRVATT
mmetsp:Transcript_2404/g.4915  ORF Transcript_2404/g.4915 Transcript_2404/m.4915 type:complete len:223 (-) Transcript_2404:1123-1791(-)